MNGIVNDKKGHNIVNNKYKAALLISQTAYLLRNESKKKDRYAMVIGLNHVSQVNLNN